MGPRRESVRARGPEPSWGRAVRGAGPEPRGAGRARGLDSGRRRPRPVSAGQPRRPGPTAPASVPQRAAPPGAQEAGSVPPGSPSPCGNRHVLCPFCSRPVHRQVPRASHEIGSHSGGRARCPRSGEAGTRRPSARSSGDISPGFCVVLLEREWGGGGATQKHADWLPPVPTDLGLGNLQPRSMPWTRHPPAPR